MPSRSQAAIEAIIATMLEFSEDECSDLKDVYQSQELSSDDLREFNFLELDLLWSVY